MEGYGSLRQQDMPMPSAFQLVAAGFSIAFSETYGGAKSNL